MARLRLTSIEIKAVLAAAGNADPAMWEDYATDKEGDEMFEAFERGIEKLRRKLADMNGGAGA